jgi:hypothetical protein
MRAISGAQGPGPDGRPRPRAGGRRRRRARRSIGARLAAAAAALAVLAGLVVLANVTGVLPSSLASRALPPLLGGPSPVARTADDPARAPGRPAPAPLQVGVVGSQAPQAADQVASLGAHVMRDEFTTSTTVEQLAPVVDRLAARGIRLQPLVGWDNGSPAPDLTAVARWAAAFGPGGSHWAGRTDVDPSVAMTDIELGNENAFYYKSGLPDDADYHALGTAYGRRSVEAARAVNRANPAVGVLVELESADGKRSSWIDDTLNAGGPDLVRLMHGPVIHPYGPDWQQKIDRDTGFLRAHGVTMPFFVTEWGISSDNGPALSGNYDFPVDLTYDRAGALLSTALDRMGAEPAKVRQVLLYQLGDQRDPGSDAEREHYFGLFRRDGSDKGAYTAAVRSACRRFP